MEISCDVGFSSVVFSRNSRLFRVPIAVDQEFQAVSGDGLDRRNLGCFGKVLVDPEDALGLVEQDVSVLVLVDVQDIGTDIHDREA